MLAQTDLSAFTVNGGTVLRPTDDQWNRILQGESIDKATMGPLDSAKALLRFAQEYPVFWAGIYKPGQYVGWAPILVLHTPKMIQRVHIENRKCTHCEWTGIIATPIVLELYFGTDDPMGYYHAAFEITPVPCPRCGQKLSGHPIWFSAE